MFTLLTSNTISIIMTCCCICTNWLFWISLVSGYFLYTFIKNRRNKTLIANQTYITKDSTVLITGGSMGIGLGLVKMLFEKTKCRVINVDIRESAFPELQELARSYGTTVDCYRCDLSSIEDLNRVFDSIIKKYNKIDFLINNAGLSFNKMFSDLKEEEMIKVFMVNTIAPSLICKKIIPLMQKNKSGHVVTVASIASQITRNYCPNLAAMAPDYVASKWAIFGWHESLRYRQHFT